MTTYQLAREEVTGPHHAFDRDSGSIVCGWDGPFTLYEDSFNPAHPFACGNCAAAVREARSEALPVSTLTPGERVDVLSMSGDVLCSVVVRQHQLVRLDEFSDPPFNRHRVFAHLLHLDVSSAADAACVGEHLPAGAEVRITATETLPPLRVREVQDAAAMTIDGKSVSRREILLVPITAA